MRRKIASLSLLTKFGALSFVFLALLGWLLAHVLANVIEERARGNAKASATAIADLAIAHYLSADEMNSPLSPERIRVLDRRLVADDLKRVGIERLNIFNAEPEIVYSDNHTKIGADARESANVRRALAGHVGTHLATGINHDGTGEKTLEVFVPVRFGGARRPNGVTEIYIPYGPIEQAIARDKLRVYGVLMLGLLALYAALFRLVRSGSRALRSQLAENRHQATHDSLTGLPNRKLMYEDAARRFAGDGEASLLLLDLDGFKEINDSLGHEHGDRVLYEVAQRLTAVAGDGDLLVRLGGDEFAVLSSEAVTPEGAVALAERLRSALAEPFVLPTLSLRLDGGIGIALAPLHGSEIGTLLRRADIAMYRSKREQTGVELYRPEWDEVEPSRLSLAGELERAISEEELVVHYQPQIDAATGDVVAAEALVRWQHPERGLIPPNDFIPLAETTGVIGDLTRYVLARALDQQVAWRDAGFDVAVAVNFAGANIFDATMRDTVERMLAERGVAPSRLIVEVSERTVVHDPERLAELLGSLRSLGVAASLDDFGTGRSSLAYVRNLPVDEIKVDRSFVGTMAVDGADAAIVSATLALAQALGLRVVAEGVEDEDTLVALTAGGCDVAQGYLISRPVPADQMLTWLREREVALAARPAPESASA